jgi:REP element-mobilizing transposase RayT
MAEPLAYFITWTTYGTWLPGDARGWVEAGVFGIQAADAMREQAAREHLVGPPVYLGVQERDISIATIRDHCTIRRWELHAVNARSNHVHVVVTAPGYKPDPVMVQFKAWCTRRLNEQGRRSLERWWTKGGSTRWINDVQYLLNATHYVTDLQ